MWGEWLEQEVGTCNPRVGEVTLRGEIRFPKHEGPGVCQALMREMPFCYFWLVGSMY